MVNDYKHNIEAILRAYYIKYDRLLELNKVVISNTNIQNPDHIDIYIDLYDMLKSVYTVDVYANNRLSICSSVINLVAHIRGYYMTRHRLWTRIFVVYGEDTADNHRRFYQDFGDDHMDKSIKYDSIKEFINSQLELVKILCAYINEVYFVHKKTDFSLFTYDNILKNKDSISIIFTRSKYVNQIPALLNNVYIFRPKKSKDNGASVDLSYVVYYNNAIITHYMKSPSVLDKLKYINPNMLSLFLTINGCSDKHVTPLINISRTTNIIIDAVRSNRILNGYNSDMNYVYSNVLAPNNINIDIVSFINRFKAIDIPYQNMIYQSQVESKDYTWFIDLNDPNTVRTINNQYFIDNPLDLNNL